MSDVIMDRNVRAKFEHWFSDEGKYPNAVERGPGGAYMLMAAASAWESWKAAAMEEREACAKVCDALEREWANGWADNCAYSIRARGKQEKV